MSNQSGAKTNRETWTRVARLIADHPAVKQVRLDSQNHGVTVGFYQAPSKEALDEIKSAVRRELSGDWDISIEADGEFPALHLHKVSRYTTEIHRERQDVSDSQRAGRCFPEGATDPPGAVRGLSWIGSESACYPSELLL